MSICLILSMNKSHNNNVGRPQKCRFVKFPPNITYYKPRGIPMNELEEVNLTIDELESVRLADFEGLYHKEAATKMGISRQTFGRIITSARKKISSGIINGNAIKIEGGNYNLRSEVINEQ